MSDPIDAWLRRFALDDFLRAHVAEVVAALPAAVRQELMADPRFMLADYDPAAPGGDGMHVPMGMPGVGQASRSVVLRRTLRRRPAAFVRYVIAHELAHAHLRNDGRSPGDDPERAADALAEEWGFPRVSGA